ncbi:MULTISPECIES: type II toxin-antitoxin system ParD family antitoxin [unclassified Neorhizobium]|uniref:ribbon-helix-helix domain-containing protein n=1 Tax=unclassified Neorhizobium TaxID=2629175 RepID=UPI000CF941E2|nr:MULTISPECIES: type II toxin-antitoxin system ParD family antitoxin [unclassified Neorhizobium]
MGEQKLSITLPDDMADAIKEWVESGRYSSTDDAMRAAVGALLREDEDQESRIEAIRQRVRKSIDDPRPSLTGAEVRQHLDALYARHKS